MQCDDRGPHRHMDDEYRSETLSQLHPLLPFLISVSFYCLDMTSLFSMSLQDAFMNMVPLAEINSM